MAAALLATVCWLTVLACSRTGGEGSGEAAADSERSGKDAEYLLLMTELKLAELDKPYLMLDPKSCELRLKLKGAVIWNQRFEVEAADSGDVDEFVGRFRGRQGRVAQPLRGKHLYAARERTADTLLTIVSQALNVKPELLQRDLPCRFRLAWGRGAILEVQTGIEARAVSVIGNILAELRYALQRPWGQTVVRVRVPAEEALTLYRSAYLGMPTILYPGVSHY